MHSSTKELLLAVFCILLAMVTIQSGASLAKQLFPIVGPEGTTALRLGFSATILCLIFKPWKHLPAAGQRFPILIYGLSLGGMNILFYYAIERIPLGIGVALEFTGPLAVALFSSRRKRDLFWVGCAIAGILLLLPDMKGQESLDPVGVILALAAGACWAGYILFGKKTGNQGSGGATVAMGMTISAIVLVPYGGILQASSFSWDIIPLGIAIAVLSSALPYTLEMITLRNMSPQGFSIMMSLEPAIAALAGLVILGELLSIWQWLAILLVIIASVGSSTSNSKKQPVPA
ncbi:DMT family transporter [Pseudoalteromonas sp. 120-MNA-CIBAN-0494]|uniref:DMT family transporter n=1 Tax=unclassified Pseudoalteromonas TaxID=194690 RepID=UPI00331E60A9